MMWCHLGRKEGKIRKERKKERKEKKNLLFLFSSFFPWAAVFVALLQWMNSGIICFFLSKQWQLVFSTHILHAWYFQIAFTDTEHLIGDAAGG